MSDQGTAEDAMSKAFGCIVGGVIAIILFLGFCAWWIFH